MNHPFVERTVFSWIWPAAITAVVVLLGLSYFLPPLPMVEVDAASRECVRVFKPNGRRIPDGCKWLKDYERDGGHYHMVYIAPRYLREKGDMSLPDVAARPH